MAAKETPLQAVKRLYGSKDKLVETVAKALSDLEEQAEGFKERLKVASNQKLLRLAEVAREVKASYGSKDKLAEAVAGALNRAKDADYVAKLKTLSITRLSEMKAAVDKRRRRGKAA